MGGHPLKLAYLASRHIWVYIWVYPFSLPSKLTQILIYGGCLCLGFWINPDMKPREIGIYGWHFITIHHQAKTDIDMDSDDYAYEVDIAMDVDDSGQMLKG